MAAPAPFFSGVHAKYVFVYDNVKKVLDVQKWNCKRKTTNAEDGVQGEIRNRMYAYTDGYNLSITALLTDTDPIVTMLIDQDNDDANALPKAKSLGIGVIPPNQRKAAYNATEVTILDWEWLMSGRTDRGMVTIPLFARFFKPVKVF